MHSAFITPCGFSGHADCSECWHGADGGTLNAERSVHGSVLAWAKDRHHAPLSPPKIHRASPHSLHGVGYVLGLCGVLSNCRHQNACNRWPGIRAKTRCVRGVSSKPFGLITLHTVRRPHPLRIGGSSSAVSLVWDGQPTQGEPYGQQRRY